MPSVFPSSVVRLLFGTAASFLVATTGAHASAGTASEALAQALTGEIALQRHLMPQAWKSFMATAEAAHDSRYAERAWETAVASRSPENAALALTLWRKLAPEDARTGILASAEGLLSEDAKVRSASETRLKEALAKTDNPAAMIAKVTELTAAAENKKAVYESLARLTQPYIKKTPRWNSCSPRPRTPRGSRIKRCSMPSAP